MVTHGIREFVTRDWQAVRDQKDTYWGARVLRMGPLEALRIANELRRFVQLQNPSWPDAAARSADLQAHVRLATLLRRAGSIRRR